MSSGKTHDRAIVIVSLGLTAGAIATSNPITGLALGGSCLIGGLYLSPDLDLLQSRPTNRWGVFKVLWKPYRKLNASHRLSASHRPIIGTIARILYCLLFLVPAYLVALSMGAPQLPLERILVSSHLITVIIGLLISEWVHLFLDWQSSLRKKK